MPLFEKNKDLFRSTSYSVFIFEVSRHSTCSLLSKSRNVSSQKSVLKTWNFLKNKPPKIISWKFSTPDFFRTLRNLDFERIATRLPRVVFKGPLISTLTVPDLTHQVGDDERYVYTFLYVYTCFIHVSNLYTGVNMYVRMYVCIYQILTWAKNTCIHDTGSYLFSTIRFNPPSLAQSCFPAEYVGISWGMCQTCGKMTKIHFTAPSESKR